jgi:LPXTG-site transpeptidase (sortase) family protein
MNNPFEVTPRKRSVRIKKKGVIYHNPNIFYRILFYIGTLGIIVAVIYFIYLYQPLAYSWLTYEGKLKNQKEVVVEQPTQIVSDEFSIMVPKIGIWSKKIVAGVSPYNEKEYLKVLEQDLVAQSDTSFLPGSGNGKTIYLFAHSTQQSLDMVRKNSVFYLLGELNNDDVIYINYKGRLYTYKVYMKKVVSAKEINYLNYAENDKEVLILQTCWPLGTNWNRLLIFAQKI